MPSQGFALRPIELCDLPTLKHWRGLPDIQRHLRHPTTSWPQHLAWWWRTKHDRTCRVWAITLNGELVGIGGFYYRRLGAAEVSVIVMSDGVEDWAAERYVVEHLLTPAGRKWGLYVLYAEVLSTAPLKRHTVFPTHGTVTADTYSTLYRWSIT